jgi:hypothetical protein
LSGVHVVVYVSPVPLDPELLLLLDPLAPLDELLLLAPELPDEDEEEEDEVGIPVSFAPEHATSAESEADARSKGSTRDIMPVMPRH